MLLIHNGYVKTMTCADIENGAVLIDDNGKIAAVGKDLKAPAGTTVIDAKGNLVTPGCVEAHCHIGLSGTPGVWQNSDINEKSDPVTPHLRAIDGINPRDEKLTLALRGGITTACIGPGSANVVGGTFVAIKLAGECVDDMILKNPVAMKCAFGENPKNVYSQVAKKAPVTRMQIAGQLRELLAKAKNYAAQKEAGKNPPLDVKLEAMTPVIKKEIPLKAHAHRADDILTSIRIAKKFDVKLTLDHCTEGFLIAKHLAKEGYPAIVGPFFPGKSKIELQNKGPHNVGFLHKAGVKACITTDAPVVALEFLPLCAGLACKTGLPYDEAWRAITLTPAEIMHIDDRVGSLEVGKDGDVVIWDSDPLTAVGAAPLYTIVEGKVAYCAQNLK